jgi:glycine cleavage system H protein
MNLINYYFTETEEWIKVEGDYGYVGITEKASHELGSIAYLDLPFIKKYKKGDVIATIESTKAASDIYAPVSFEVVESNDSLLDDLDRITTDPFNEYIAKVRILNPEELKSLKKKTYEQVHTAH